MLTLAENPKRRKRTRRRRNPDGTFVSASTANNPRRKRTKRRRNPETAVSANPVRHHRKRRRNPFGLDQVTETAYGVGLEEMGAGVVGLVGTEILGAQLDAMLPSAGPRPPDSVVDIGYAIRKAAPRALAAAGLYFLAKQFGLKRSVTDAVGITGAASAAGQLIGASHLAPDLIKDGSLMIGHREPNRLPPPPPLERLAERTTSASVSPI